MESQYSSGILNYEKILQLTFWFERESTSVGRFSLVDCKKWGGLYALHFTVLFFLFFFSLSRGLFLLQEETLLLRISEFTRTKDFFWFAEKRLIFANHLAWLSALHLNIANISLWKSKRYLTKNFWKLHKIEKISGIGKMQDWKLYSCTRRDIQCMHRITDNVCVCAVSGILTA